MAIALLVENQPASAQLQVNSVNDWAAGRAPCDGRLGYLWETRRVIAGAREAGIAAIGQDHRPQAAPRFWDRAERTLERARMMGVLGCS